MEGADNFATKFLVADACAVEWRADPAGGCGALFFGLGARGVLGAADTARARVFAACSRTFRVASPETCSVAGVLGPVVGVLGALQAALALRLLLGDATAAGELWSYTALSGALRHSRVERQARCALCSGGIADTDAARYAPKECAA